MFKYRPELDGLRAIAVLSVLLFHAGLKRFEGGFVGVDIFFVLSGYLITSIIMEEIKNNRFTFSGFYERRIRRLLPPIVPVLIITITLSVLFLSEDQLQGVFKSIYAALGLSSNWYFLSTVGYFDTSGQNAPLLHTWSLSIEEQFYLVFPALILLIAIKKIKRPLIIFTIILIASFAYSTYLAISKETENAFYNSFGRIWELLVGALVAYSRIKSPNKVRHIDTIEITGFLMVLWSILKFEPDMVFPGPAALLPTLGTALIIAAGGKGRYISPFLSRKPLVLTGLISYSLYLWHWPLLVFIKSIKPTTSPLIIVFTIAIAFALSILSYRYIECPIRKKSYLPTRRSAYTFAIISITLLTGSVAVVSTPELNNLRTSASEIAYRTVYGTRATPIRIIEREKSNYLSTLNLNFTGDSGEFSIEKHQGYTCSLDNGNSENSIINCIIGQAHKKNILILGDSIGRDTLNAFRRMYPSKNFLMIHNSSCPPADFKFKGKICFKNLSSILYTVFKEIEIEGVLINFSYNPEYWKEIKNGLLEIKRHTNNVAILGVAPIFKLPVNDYLRGLWGDSTPPDIKKTDKSMIKWNLEQTVVEISQIAKEQKITFINLTPFYHPQDSFLIWIDGDPRKPLFIDNQHLTNLGITKLGEFLSTQPEIKKFLLQSL